jgi:GrpB-like predicted nucleotidyltransferase (UPF0157 family)
MKYIREWSENWSNDFEEIVRRLKSYLPGGCQMHHVGSTSIPNMPAKDVIDVDIECPRGSMDRVIGRLAEAGYKHEGNLGIPTREAFRLCNETGIVRLPSHHLYACETDSPELRRHLAFRDYLIALPERARWLANEKRAADGRAASRDAYIEGKAVAYEKVISEAMSWIGKK